MRTAALTLLAIVVEISPKASAAVIGRDLQSSGDGLLTYDTVNNRAWFDLPETSGVSLAEVVSQMTPGGRLEGFQFATLADVTALAASAQVGWTAGWSLPFSSEPHVPEFVELLGWVVRLTGGVMPETRVAMGLIAVDNTTSVPSFDDTNFFVISSYEPLPDGIVNPGRFDNSPRGGVFTGRPFTSSPEHPPLGVGDVGPFWLYRAVPEPGVALLLLQAGAGIIVGRFRRARAVGPGVHLRA